MNKRSNGGFTLIELVVVITILGILAAFAVPRFASLEGQERLASTQALAGSIRSGAALAHAVWLAQGDPASTSVTMEGQPITMAFGYPDAATIDGTLDRPLRILDAHASRRGRIHERIAVRQARSPLLRDVYAAGVRRTKLRKSSRRRAAARTSASTSAVPRRFPRA